MQANKSNIALNLLQPVPSNQESEAVISLECNRKDEFLALG
jgi:hypothetical protein